jgi:hypothetical protein
MINIPHIDKHIWNIEEQTIGLISELSQQGCVRITMDQEGSDLTELGLYSLLDDICKTFKFQKSSIVIETCNQLEEHPEYIIQKHPPLYISSGQKFAKNNIPTKKNLTKHFGIFISRSNWQRLWIASELHKNYKEKTSMTFHYDSLSEYHRPHLGVDNLIRAIGARVALDLTSEFLPILPLKNDAVDSYPILTPAHFSISKIYHEFFVELVCETFVAGKTFYPTEKTWRPLICRTPFMVHGPVNFLKNLKKLGFKTFDKWWDESYDEDAALDDGKLSIKTIQNNIDILSNLTIKELNNMYDDMSDTLEHNYQRFMTLKDHEFKILWP